MILPPAVGESATRKRRQLVGQDEYGNDVYDWIDSPLTRLAFAARSEFEDTQGRDQIIHGVVVYAPAGTDLIATDRIEWRGGLYDVEGRPHPWHDPHTGFPAGLQASLVRITG